MTTCPTSLQPASDLTPSDQYLVDGICPTCGRPFHWWDLRPTHVIPFHPAEYRPEYEAWCRDIDQLACWGGYPDWVANPVFYWTSETIEGLYAQGMTPEQVMAAAVEHYSEVSG